MLPECGRRGPDKEYCDSSTYQAATLGNTARQMLSKQLPLLASLKLRGTMSSGLDRGQINNLQGHNSFPYDSRVWSTNARLWLGLCVCASLARDMRKRVSCARSSTRCQQENIVVFIKKTKTATDHSI